MTRAAAYRGQPVLVLLMLLAAWLGVRVVLWQSPFPAPLAVAAGAAAQLIAPATENTPRTKPEAAPADPPLPAPRAPREPFWLAPAADSAPLAEPSAGGWALAAHPAPARLPPRIAGGQVLLLAAAFSHFEVPAELAAAVTRGPATPAAIPPFPALAADTARLPDRRWSGDVWLLARRDTTTPITSGRGSYGRSQIGSVLRYRLAPHSPHRPAVYLRASAALADTREADVAVGLAGRPVPGIPVAVAGEVRGARFGDRTEARPSAFAYSEFPPLKLPLGVRGEAYVQGGYVGGRFATAFVDGQVRVDRQVARFGSAELRAGGGAWGGAQKGARRLDLGPGATLALDLGGAPLRMSADWRFRVAGEANPSSGPALTLSSGF